MEQATYFFSIVVPTYNRPEPLKTCLRSLTQLDYPRDRFEVIVVDDGSNPPLDTVVSPFQDQLNLTLIRQTNAGPAQARNTGAAKAKGTVLTFTDDDCTPAPDWLTRLEAHFTLAPDCLIGGKTINALPNNLFSTTSQLIVDLVYRHYNANPTQARFFASNNFSVATEHFQAIGGFNPKFHTSEDREFCDRWLNQGRSMLYASDVHIYHAHHLKLSSFWRQHFSYGCGAFHFHRLRFQRGMGQVNIEPNFYIKLLTYPFMQSTSTHPKLLLAALFVLSQVASTAGFFREKVKQPPLETLNSVNQA